MIAEIKHILEEVKGVPGLAGRLHDTASLIDDVGLDSLEMLTFMLRVEQDLDVEIDFEAMDFSHLQSIHRLSEFFEGMKSTPDEPSA